MPQPRLDTILNRLRAFRRAAGLSMSGLALHAGLSRAALVGIDDEDWSPSSTTVRALEDLIPADWKEGEPLPAALIEQLARTAEHPARTSTKSEVVATADATKSDGPQATLPAPADKAA